MPKQPFVITIDEISDINIWDVRNLFCLQTISVAKAKQFKDNGLHGLIVFSSRAFWGYGTQFHLFDTAEETVNEAADLALERENLRPITAVYNSHYNFICVQNARDIKIYSCEDGSL